MLSKRIMKNHKIWWVPRIELYNQKLTMHILNGIYIEVCLQQRKCVFSFAIVATDKSGTHATFLVPENNL